MPKHDFNDFFSKNIPTETEIIANWISYDSTEPYVSVICTSFNHQEYIENTIKSFLLQETTLPFEIIIHDDASTDNTVSIIQKYAKKYPRIIKTTLQKNNQFSINGHLPFLNCIKASSGKFVALCEGDDFWIASNKLETQIQASILNPEVFLFVHPAIQVEEGRKNLLINNHHNEKTIIPLKKLIAEGAGFVPTASLFIKKKSLINLIPIM